ncbi:MAG: Si-specific NAD(P)(+) transhydrogenase [Candidatus Eisenbacteria bacterium]
MQTYDLVVIGSGPAGQRAAVQAAKLGKRVALIERQRRVGGVAINTGTIPSKTLRESVLDVIRIPQEREFGGTRPRRGDISVGDLLSRCDTVMRREREVVQSQLERNGVRLFCGLGSFQSPHVLRIDDEDGSQTLEAAHVLIAVGTEAGMPGALSVDHDRVLTSDDIPTLRVLPHALTVVGAGVIGLEYATMFAALGVEVTLIDKRNTLLEMVDREVSDALAHRARAMNVTFRLGEEVAALRRGRDDSVIVELASGKRFVSDHVLLSVGRMGATATLNLESAGLEADDRGRLAVDVHCRTPVPHIYAAGDVIGFPALASTSAEQGRLAACHMFGVPAESVPELFPYGIYAVPEIAWVGASEEDLTRRGVPYESGVARYREIARGQILGDLDGMLKILFHLETREILGVWVLGTQATELVHIGQAVMALHGGLDYLMRTVFNYPTLAECYKVAAYDGYNKMRALAAGEPEVIPQPDEERKAA